MLTYNEKKTLSFLIIASILIIFYIILTSNNISIKNQKILIKNQRICIFHMNGNIKEDFIEKYQKNKHKLANIDIINLNVSPKSSNVNLIDWNTLAENIQEKYILYDAFIIFHEKETILYTSSTLSFIIENLKIPIVFTHSDLYNTLFITTKTTIPEVMLYNNGNLLRACQTIDNGDYFVSPNYLSLTEENCLPKNNENTTFRFINPNNKIVVIKIFPGMNEQYLKTFLNNGFINGIVLESYFNGNIPINDSILYIINTLVKKGTIIVIVTPNNSEKIETDVRLIEAGILPVGNITLYAAFAKLHYLLGNVKNKNLIAELLEQNFRGELSNK